MHIKTAPVRFLDSNDVTINIESSTGCNGGDIVIVSGIAATPDARHVAISNGGFAAGGETHIASGSCKAVDRIVSVSVSIGLGCSTLEGSHKDTIVLTGGSSLIVMRPTAAVSVSWQMSGIGSLVS